MKRTAVRLTVSRGLITCPEHTKCEIKNLEAAYLCGYWPEL